MPVDMKKICASCGADVRSAKRTKDSLGRYFCQPCYISQISAKQRVQAEPDDRLAQRAKEANAIERDDRRNAFFILTIGSTLGLIFILGLIYVLFVRDWWEGKNREEFLREKASSEHFISSSQLDAAHQQLDTLLKRFGNYRFKDVGCQQKLEVVKTEANMLDAALKHRDAARAQEEASYEQRVADGEAAKREAQQTLNNLNDQARQLRDQLKIADDAFDNDAVVSELTDQYPEMKLWFKKRDEGMINPTLSALLASGAVPYSAVKHVTGLFARKVEINDELSNVSDQMASANSTLHEEPPRKRVVDDANFLPVTLAKIEAAKPNDSTGPVSTLLTAQPETQAHQPTLAPPENAQQVSKAAIDTGTVDVLPKAVPANPLLQNLAGQWHGKSLTLVIEQNGNELNMVEPSTKLHSTAFHLVNDSAVFHWSRNDDILVISGEKDGLASIACYPSASGEALDSGGNAPMPPRWHKKIRKVG